MVLEGVEVMEGVVGNRWTQEDWEFLSRVKSSSEEP